LISMYSDQYLKEGKQTKITKSIKNISKKLKCNSKEKTIGNIILWIKDNLKKKPFDEKVFRRRTVDKIIKDGYVTGCTDIALVFIALCRSSKIPAIYVEAKIKGKNKGHVWTRIYLNRKWVDIDTVSGKVDFKIEKFGENETEIGKYTEVEIGLDSWDIGIKSWEDWKNKSKKWDDIIYGKGSLGKIQEGGQD